MKTQDLSPAPVVQSSHRQQTIKVRASIHSCTVALTIPIGRGISIAARSEQSLSVHYYKGECSLRLRAQSWHQQ